MPRPPRTPGRHTGLLALNGVLIVALGAVTLLPASEAGAQRSTAPGADIRRARGDYTMVSGQFQGLAESGIYIIDAANQELVAVRWDRSRRNLAPIGFRDLSFDARGAGGGR